MLGRGRRGRAKMTLDVMVEGCTSSCFCPFSMNILCIAQVQDDAEDEDFHLSIDQSSSGRDLSTPPYTPAPLYVSRCKMMRRTRISNSRVKTNPAAAAIRKMRTLTAMAAAAREGARARRGVRAPPPPHPPSPPGRGQGEMPRGGLLHRWRRRRGRGWGRWGRQGGWRGW